MDIQHADAPLFSSQNFFELRQQKEDSIRSAVETYDANVLLNTPHADLCSYFYDKFSLEPISLAIEKISMDAEETKITENLFPFQNPLHMGMQRDISATAVKFYIPFTGDEFLLRIRPNAFTSSVPRAIIHGQDLVMTIVSPGSDSTVIQSMFRDRLSNLERYVQWSRADAIAFNTQIQSKIEELVNTRRTRLLQMHNTASALGYPMRRRSGVPLTFAAPSVRRRITPSQPPASNQPFQAEPALPMQEYDHILDVMQNMAFVLERSPSAFRSMGEEDIRQHFLVQLNGHYEGNATGETFNVSGKTDILIRDNGKNIFIAECKFWRGPAGFQSTIACLSVLPTTSV